MSLSRDWVELLPPSPRFSLEMTKINMSKLQLREGGGIILTRSIDIYIQLYRVCFFFICLSVCRFVKGNTRRKLARCFVWFILKGVQCMRYYYLNSSSYVQSAASVTCRRQGNAKLWYDVLMTRINYVSFVSTPKSALWKQALTRLDCVATIQKKGYSRFQNEVERIVANRCSKFNAYCLLSCRDNSKLIFFPSVKPLWPCIEIKVIDTNMNRYAMHKSTSMPSLNAIA